MSIADRAVAAYEAQQQEERLAKEAAKVRRRVIAYNDISLALEELNLEVEEFELTGDFNGTTWKVVVPIDEDCFLVATCIVPLGVNTPTTKLRVQAEDELYYDMPPGAEGHGGTYGFYGLHGWEMEVSDLASLGRAISKVRQARESWRRKHGVSQDSEMQKEVE